jgi:phenylacetate-CoA ligase
MRFYKDVMLDNSKPIDEIKSQQEVALRRIIGFCFDHVPYYQRLFESLKLTKSDINTIQDLDKIPVLTKERIKNEPESFSPKGMRMKIIHSNTGGTTGSPLKYKMSQECYCRGIALLLRGWGFAGYRPGDRIAVIAGASLVSNKETIKKRAQELILNYRQYSSYGMDSEILHKYLLHMNQWRPCYLRGYASSLYLLAKHIEENSIELAFRMKGIFSTAEVLSINQRELIERIFQMKVFDNYGLNDGGVSAFECSEHNGMHIDFERSILQTVDHNGAVVTGKTGKIIATSLYNTAMPFIRYDTGDLGLIDDTSTCPCGNKRHLLKKIFGRTTDYLKLNNKFIGSPVLTVLMGKVDVENYQIMQKDINEVDIKYVKKNMLGLDDENLIRKSFSEHVGAIRINFIKVNPDGLSAENKHKFIINEVCR